MTGRAHDIVLHVINEPFYRVATLNGEWWGVGVCHHGQVDGGLEGRRQKEEKKGTEVELDCTQHLTWSGKDVCGCAC
jgi:hypothetical protein